MARQGFEVVQGPQPAVEDDLRNRGVLADFDGSPHPTLFGLLAFGNQPQSAPQDRQLLDRVHRLRGQRSRRRRDPRHRSQRTSRRAGGSSTRLGAGSRAFENHDDVRRKDTPLPPLAAVRGAIVNAVVHRDYAITGSKVLLEPGFIQLALKPFHALFGRGFVDQVLRESPLVRLASTRAVQVQFEAIFHLQPECEHQGRSRSLVGQDRVPKQVELLPRPPRSPPVLRHSIGRGPLRTSRHSRSRPCHEASWAK